MFGIKFIKVQPTTYLLQYRGGKIVREGLGHSFFYFAPTTSLVAVPVASTDVPFIFQETTADFQTVTIQGQVTYRVGEPKRLAALLNYTLAPNGQKYAAEDPEKLQLDGASMWALVEPVRLTRKTSFASARRSPLTRTLMAWTVSPGAKVTESDAAW